MTTIPKNALVQAFLSDHQHFMRLLSQTAAALSCGNVNAARKLAVKLNTIAGPHIAFEETVLYPMIDVITQERSFVEGLYREHQGIVVALSELIEMGHLTEGRVRAITRAFEEGLDRADHCGTLVSNLSNLDECDQREAFDELRQLRARKLLWTDLKKES